MIALIRSNTAKRLTAFAKFIVISTVFVTSHPVPIVAIGFLGLVYFSTED